MVNCQMRSGTLCTVMCLVVAVTCCLTLFLTEFLNSQSDSSVRVVTNSTVLTFLLVILSVSSFMMICVNVAGRLHVSFLDISITSYVLA